MNTYRRKNIEVVQFKECNTQEVYEFTKGIVSNFDFQKNGKMIARYQYYSKESDKMCDGFIFEGNYIILKTKYHFNMSEPTYKIEVYDERNFELQYEIIKDNTNEK